MKTKTDGGRDKREIETERRKKMGPREGRGRRSKMHIIRTHALICFSI